MSAIPKIVKIRMGHDRTYVKLLLKNVGKSELPEGTVEIKLTYRDRTVQRDSIFNYTPLAPDESTWMTISTASVNSNAKKMEGVGYNLPNDGKLELNFVCHRKFFAWWLTN